MNHYSILGEPDLPIDAFQPRFGGMTLHGKSRPPPAPDYKGAAEATAAGNLAAAQTATEANRVNQYNPYGSSVYTQTPGASTFDQAGYDAAMQQYNDQLKNSAGSQGTWVPGTQGVGMDNSGGTDGYWTGGTTPGAAPTAPSRDTFTKTGNPTWSQTTSLSPVGQQLLDQSNKTALGLAGLQDTATSRVAGQQAQGWNDAGIQGIGSVFNPSSLPQGGQVMDMSKIGPGGQVMDMSKVGPGGQVMDMSKIGPGGTALNPSNYSMGSVFDSSKLSGMGSAYDPRSATNTATESIMARLNPQIDRQRNMLSQQLANQGIAQGTEAYKNAYTDQNQRENDLLNQASLSGINLGLTQQGQTYNQMNQNRTLGANEQAQNFGQANTNYSNGLLGQNQQFNQSQNLQAQNAALQGQQFNQAQSGQAQNAALQGQQFNQAQSGQAQNAALQGQQFNQANQNQSLAMAQQGQQFNQSLAANQQGIQDQNYFANRDMNQLNALRSGSQVTNPTFSAVPQQATTAGPDLYGAANAQYTNALASTNAQNANSTNMLNGLFGLGGAFLGA